MAYFGVQPSSVFTGSGAKNVFNGDGSTTAFTMSQTVAITTDIEVFVGNVRQEPSVAYNVSGFTLTFTGTPASGTGNIYVVHQNSNLGSVAVTAGLAVNASTLTASSTLAVTGASTLSGGVAVTGNVTATGTVEPAGDTAAGDNAAIGFTAAEGLILTGQGSTNDVTIKNDADADVIEIPTGTTNVTVAGTLGSGGLITSGAGITGAGLLTTGGNVVIPNGGNIGTVGDTDAISIASNGVVTFSQTPVGDNGGTVVQIKNVQTGAKSSGTTVIPLDDSIPQKTEGIEVMTLAITPTSTSTRLKIEVQVYMANDSGDDHIVALFQDGTANALAAGINFQVTVNGCTEHSFSHNMAAGTTSATTFKVRLGCDSSGTTTFNGFGNARKLGGTMASSITITEYSV